MRYDSDSPCGWIVLHSVQKMRSRQLSFGQHGSCISRNRSPKEQTSNLQSFDNSTKFMLRALWGKNDECSICCKIFRRNLKISPLNVIMSLELTSDISLLQQEVMSWVRTAALFSRFQKSNIVYS